MVLLAGWLCWTVDGVIYSLSLVLVFLSAYEEGGKKVTLAQIVGVLYT